MTLGATWRSRVARRLLSLSVRPIHVIAALPLIGMAVLTPWLLALPIYVDELESKAINSRYLLDGGKLIYLLPSCNGFLEPMPISWYPARLLDVAIFADMTDPQRLRYWGCAIFLA